MLKAQLTLHPYNRVRDFCSLRGRWQSSVFWHSTVWQAGSNVHISFLSSLLCILSSFYPLSFFRTSYPSTKHPLVRLKHPRKILKWYPSSLDETSFSHFNFITFSLHSVQPIRGALRGISQPCIPLSSTTASNKHCPFLPLWIWEQLFLCFTGKDMR